MDCKGIDLTTVFSHAIQEGKITDVEIVETLGQFQDADINEVYDQLIQAGVKISAADPEPVEDILPKEEQTDGSIDSMRLYMNEIGQYPILSQQEELELAQQMAAGRRAAEALENKSCDMSSDVLDDLIQKVKAGEKAKTKLVESNLRFVVFLAHSFENQALPLPDLIQSGNIGLMNGIDRYDPDKGFRLTTYASWWVKQAMMREMANHGRLIRLPVHISEKIRKINTIMTRLNQTTTGQVTMEQIAKEAGISVAELSMLQNSAKDICSLDSPVGEDDSATLGDLIVADAESPEELCERTVLSEAIHSIMARVLSDKEQQVVILRMGMDGYHPHTLEEIGQKMNVTRERVRQIEGKALRKLRATGQRKAYIDFVDASVRGE